MKNTGAVKNPLSVIAIFAGFAEISGTGVLPFVEPQNQELYIWFLILFPSSLVLMFFCTLNRNHRVLYAPSDYQSDESFQENVNGGRSQREGITSIKELIESKVTEGLNSTDGTQTNESIAQKITESIKTSSFITINAHSLTGSLDDKFDLPHVAFTSLSNLTDEIFFLLHDYVGPFEYGYSWVLTTESGEVIKNARMITKTRKGEPCIDHRSLIEVGILPGMTINVSRPNS